MYVFNLSTGYQFFKPEYTPDYKREPIVSTLKGAPLQVDYPNDAES